jgi:hypothetical protein
MSKYAGVRRAEIKRPYKVHPIWRGIGLVIIILIPLIAWASAQILVDWAKTTDIVEVQRFARGIASPISFPDWFTALPFLRDFARWVRSIPDLKLHLVFFFLIAIVLSGVLSIIYSMVYRAMVPRYTPLDEPAPKVRAKKYTR